MTPSQKAKELGCKSLLQVAEEIGQSKQTLINWFNNPKKRKLFEVVCMYTALKSKNIKGQK